MERDNEERWIKHTIKVIRDNDEYKEQVRLDNLKEDYDDRITGWHWSESCRNKDYEFEMIVETDYNHPWYTRILKIKDVDVSNLRIYI